MRSGGTDDKGAPFGPLQCFQRNKALAIPEAADGDSTEPSEFHLRHDESEPGPTARLDRSFEPRTRPRLVTSYEVPIAKAVGERRHLHVVGVRRREHGFRTNLATIELQAPRVRVGHRLRIRP